MKSLFLVVSVIRSAETRSLVKIVLEGAGHRVIESGGFAQTRSLLQNGLKPDLLFIECTSSDLPEIIQFRRAAGPNLNLNLCLVIGIADQDLGREASEYGIPHVLEKPVTREDIESVVDRIDPLALQQGAARGVTTAPANHAASDPEIAADMRAVPYIEELGDGRYFLAASPKMHEIHRQVKLLGNVDANVLILGESGTGKEVIAHLIHKNSLRSRTGFLNVNCAALPADLLESELFGHRQGAFTGAIRDRAGKFEQANRGTLLLDEIGEIPVQMQAKLLHVLQDGQFTRLGGQESTKVDVRVLAATNVHIQSALHQKSFREDLYYRISAFTINVPPLRERREEIPYLIEETIRRAPSEMKHGVAGSFPSQLIDLAVLCDWRGNLRELRNFVMRNLIMRDSDAAVRELEAKIASAGGSANQDRSDAAFSHSPGMRSIVRDVKERTETQLIRDALEVFGWNRRRTAQYLNISYRGLLYKIQQHRITPRSAREINEAFRAYRSARTTVT